MLFSRHLLLVFLVVIFALAHQLMYEVVASNLHHRCRVCLNTVHSWQQHWAAHGVSSQLPLQALAAADSADFTDEAVMEAEKEALDFCVELVRYTPIHTASFRQSAGCALHRGRCRFRPRVGKVTAESNADPNSGSTGWEQGDTGDDLPENPWVRLLAPVLGFDPQRWDRLLGHLATEAQVSGPEEELWEALVGDSDQRQPTTGGRDDADDVHEDKTSLRTASAWCHSLLRELHGFPLAMARSLQSSGCASVGPTGEFHHSAPGAFCSPGVLCNCLRSAEAGGEPYCADPREVAAVATGSAWPPPSPKKLPEDQSSPSKVLPRIDWERIVADAGICVNPARAASGGVADALRKSLPPPPTIEPLLDENAP